MSAGARFLFVLRRFEDSLFRWIGLDGNIQALACNTVLSPRNARSGTDLTPHCQEPSVLDDIFDSHLWAVPKFRRSLERRLTRKMGGDKHFKTYGLPKNNIVACLECGHWHEKHTICGHCYEKVMEETKAMQEAMGEEANFYSPQKEVDFVYEGEENKNLQDTFVVEMKKKRPEWFAKSLTSKLPLSDRS